MEILILLTLLITIFSACVADPKVPHDASAMWIEDSLIQLTTDNASHTIGYKFNITIWTNVSFTSGAWQFRLHYDKALLNATGCWYTRPDLGKSDFFSNLTVTMPVDPSFGAYNATHDYLLFAESWLMGPKRNPGWGSLAWVEFKVLAVPPPGGQLQTLLDISSDYPSYTFVMKEDRTKPALNIYDCQYIFTSGAAPPTMHTLTITSATGGTTNPAPGSYQFTEGTVVTVNSISDPGYILLRWELNGSYAGSAPSIDVTMDTDHALHAIFTTTKPPIPIGGARLYVDPPMIVDPTKVPSSTFTINITIYNVTDVRVCKFNLTYDTSILSWVGIEILRVQGQLPTGKTILDDEAGYIWVRLTYQTPFSTETAIPLVTIKLHVDASGSTCYNLHDTELTNSTGQPIPHDAFGGCFSQYRSDVSVISVIPSRSWVYQSWLLDINVTAKNEGDIDATFHLTAYYDGNLIGNITIENLPPDDEITHTFVWNTTEVAPCHNYTISARASIVPYEIDIIDNEYMDGKVKVRFFGDVDDNGKVDTSDLFLVALAFGSYPGHPNWNPEADLNQSLAIDIQDIYSVATNFGKSCSP